MPSMAKMYISHSGNGPKEVEFTDRVSVGFYNMNQNFEVWVLSEKETPVFILNAKAQLSQVDIPLITFHLKRYIISAYTKGAS